jgi:parvulin-like peptidyl-prolyl isomerase
MGRLRRQVLDQLVEEELLYQLSQKEKVQVPEKRVDEEVQTLQSRFLSPEEYEASLKEQGLTPALARERVRRNLAVEEIIRQKTTGGAGPSEAEIAEYYKKNRERLRRAESARVQQIFVRLPPRSDPETKGRARQALEALIKEIRGGKDFGAAIREYSQGTDQGPGGDLGWVTRNGPTPILADAALKLKVGEISDVLETPAGFHVLKVLEKKPGGEASLEEARAQVESLLRQQKEREALASLVAKLKTEARIEFVTPVP